MKSVYITIAFTLLIVLPYLTFAQTPNTIDTESIICEYALVPNRGDPTRLAIQKTLVGSIGYNFPNTAPLNAVIQDISMAGDCETPTDPTDDFDVSLNNIEQGQRDNIPSPTCYVPDNQVNYSIPFAVTFSYVYNQISYTQQFTLMCQILVKSDVTITQFCSPTLIPVNASEYEQVRFNVTNVVYNNGEAPLVDVVLTGGGVPKPMFNLAIGETVVFTDFYYPLTNPTYEDLPPSFNAYAAYVVGLNQIVGFPGASASETVPCYGIHGTTAISTSFTCNVTRVNVGNRQIWVDRVIGEIDNSGLPLANIRVFIPSNSSALPDFEYSFIATGQIENFEKDIQIPSDPTIPISHVIDVYGESGILYATPPQSLNVNVDCPGVNYNLTNASSNILLTESCSVVETVQADGRILTSYVFTTTVENVGKETLVDVVVTDGEGERSPITLVSGASQSYTYTYDPANPRDSYSSSSYVTADNILIGLPSLNGSSSATCEGILYPSNLTLTETCTRTEESVGDRIQVQYQYDITVENVGYVTLVNVIVTDEQGNQSPITLAAGQSHSYSFTVNVEPTENRTSESSVTADNIYIGLPSQSLSASATCFATPSNPNILINFTCVQTLLPLADGLFQIQDTYTTTIRNIGSDVLANVVVTDETGAYSPISEFNVGAVAVYSFTINVTDPTVKRTSSSSVFGEDIDIGLADVSGSASATCPKRTNDNTGGSLFNVNITMVCDDYLVTLPNGQYERVFNYTATVTNDGDDEILAVETDETGPRPQVDLKADKSASFSYLFYPTDPLLERTASASVVANDVVIGYAPLTESASATCPQLTSEPTVLAIQNCVQQVNTSADTIELTFTTTVFNDGPDDLFDVTITNTFNGAHQTQTLTGPFLSGNNATFIFSYQVGLGLETYTSNYFVEAQNRLVGLNGANYTSSTINSCPGFPFNPSLTVTKTCEATLVDVAGTNQQQVVVTYQGLITNNGTENLIDVEAQDSSPDTAAVPTYNIGNLAVGASTTIKDSYVPTSPAQSSFTDTLLVNYMAESSQSFFSSSANAQCPGFSFRPSVKITTSCVAVIDVSDTISVTYTVTVTNNGDVNLVNLNVTEDFNTTTTTDDLNETIDLLVVGQSVQFVKVVDGGSVPSGTSNKRSIEKKRNQIPASTKAQPEESEECTEESKAQPVVSTTKPVVSTTKPVVSTTKPVVSTTKPVVSTTKPVVSTTKPVVSTTSSQPEDSEECTEESKSQPVVSTTKPVVSTTKSQPEESEECTEESKSQPVESTKSEECTEESKSQHVESTHSEECTEESKSQHVESTHSEDCTEESTHHREPSTECTEESTHHREPSHSEDCTEESTHHREPSHSQSEDRTEESTRHREPSHSKSEDCTEESTRHREPSHSQSEDCTEESTRHREPSHSQSEDCTEESTRHREPSHSQSEDCTEESTHHREPSHSHSEESTEESSESQPACSLSSVTVTYTFGLFADVIGDASVIGFGTAYSDNSGSCSVTYTYGNCETVTETETTCEDERHSDTRNDREGDHSETCKDHEGDGDHGKETCTENNDRNGQRGGDKSHGDRDHGEEESCTENNDRNSQRGGDKSHGDRDHGEEESCTENNELKSIGRA
jgi:hypothetical protein